MSKKNKNKENRISNIQKNTKSAAKNYVTYVEGMNAVDLANELNISPAKIIMKFFADGIMIDQNQPLDRDSVELVALDYDKEVRDEQIEDPAKFDEMEVVDSEDSLVTRPPVVTIMGHVDHGKTTLLDVIRNSRITSGEAGGITQHIGAYQTEINGNKITFIDTPGHAAFTEMRARGAQVTDIIILVVAADDGIMPQTIEAIHHAKDSKCPIIVAVNKIDKPHANPNKVLEQLTKYDLVPEAWGGDTIVCEISALQKLGIDDLLENVILTAEMQELKANPNRYALGSVIEASLDKGRGPVATFLVQNGTLKTGDSIVCGNTYGKVRVMEDDRHKRFKEAGPSFAVSVTGLKEVPFAGDKFSVVENDSVAQKISAERTSRARIETLNAKKPKNLADLFAEDGDKKLNLIIKADTQGSIEAVKGSIDKIKIDDIDIEIISTGVGQISNTDISLAEASDAIIIGFNVRPLSHIRKLAEEKGIEMRLYRIIYKLLEDIESAAKGLLDPEFEEVVTGQADVRETFHLSSVGTIAGCYVTDGVIKRNSLMRILRDGVVIYEGEMASLKRYKDDVKEVGKGYECGITIKKFDDIKIGDVFEASIMQEKERD